MTGHRGAAEELTQEIFMRVYERLHLFRGESRFATWFYRLAVNHTLNYHRRQRSARYEEAVDDQEMSSLASDQPGIEADVLQKQIQFQVHRAMLGLKPKLRMMVILKDIEGLSYEEIAARTNCSIGTIASRLNRARKMLARKLEHLKGAY
jgi:RNA polymerase sigma-70 factor (ECF subfamily)